LAKEKQARHRGSNAGNLNKSSVTIGSDVIVKLYRQFAGTGELQFNSNGENVKETIEDAGMYIGICRSPKGKKIKTKSFTIHYSKNDFHIVPDMPK
jgi:hypothetical protein